MDQLTRMRSQDRGTEDFAPFRRDHFDQAVGLALGLGPVVFRKGPA